VGPAPETGRAPAEPERPAEGEAGEGTLRLMVRPWAEVAVDGKPVGTTPMRPIQLAAGTHTIRLTHPDFPPVVKKVVVRAGQMSRLEVDLASEASKSP
jgi:serine/threonine-protein kinase